MPFRVIPDQTFWYQSIGVAPLFNALVGGEPPELTARKF